MTPVITLFCEGTKDSLDYKVLEKLIDPNQTILVPIGGKRTFRAYMEGYGSVSRVADKKYFRAFRDRDFDYEIPSKVSLIQDGQFLVTYRTMIENYLLHPTTLFEYIQSKGLPQARSKVKALRDAEEIFREAIVKLRFYTAARWAHGLIKSEYSDQFTFNSSWPNNSGNIPKNMSDTDCRMILSDIIGDIRTKSNQLDFGIFEKAYSDFISQFDDNFLEDTEKCLTWFNGKDLHSMLYRLIGGNNFFQNGQEGDYYDFALNTYRFRVNNFPDLIELRNILNGSVPL